MYVYIISYHDSHDYNTRTRYLEAYLHKEGYRTCVLASDFNHRTKQSVYKKRSGTEYIHVPAYDKNLSFRRIWSYLVFNKKCISKIKQINNDDIVYLLAPPNILIRSIAKIKARRTFKFFIEIGDMWPESIPIPRRIKKMCVPIFRAWSSLRDKYLSAADYVIAECDLFREQVYPYVPEEKCVRIYFCKEQLWNEYDSNKISIQDELNLCYLGSINNIIDIDFIGKLVKSISAHRRVSVHIIGCGEREQELIDTIESSGGYAIFHGAIYSDEKKQAILSRCHFALNIMKESVLVGMTMKSLDYFAFGIPMINNIHGDTWTLITQRKCGINCATNEIAEKVNHICALSQDAYDKIKNSSRNVYNELFSVPIYWSEMDRIMNSTFKE